MLFLLTIVLLVVLFVYVKVNYFTLRGPIPGLAPQFFFGNLLQSGELRGTSQALVGKEMHAIFGDIYQYWYGPFRMIGLSNVVDIEHIFNERHIYEIGRFTTDQFGIFLSNGLLCTSGYTYKRHASVILPLLRPSKILKDSETIYDCTDKLLDRWRSEMIDPSRIHVDMIQQCQDLILAIFGFIAFGYDLQTLDGDGTKERNDFATSIRDYLDISSTTLLMPPIIGKLYMKYNPRSRKALTVINQFCEQTLDELKNDQLDLDSTFKSSNIISSLYGSLQEDEKTEAAKSEEKQKGLRRDEVLSEMLMLLVASYETTSTALAWFIHLISKNPRVQAKIKAELGENRRRRLSITELDTLEYLHCVIEEVLRFTPPGASTYRRVLVDDRLPATGVQLHKGDEILINS